MRTPIWAGAAGTFLRVASCLVVLGLWGERDARACGGCFVPPPSPESEDSSITTERMIFSISKDQTTLYDEIHFSGSPASFAWVLPIQGKVDIGLSDDLLFATLDGLTAVTVNPPESDGCSYGGGGEAGGAGDAGGGEGGGGGGGGGVVIVAKQQVGPYETVQLKSSDGSALTNWLTSHGYSIPKSDKPAIDHYVMEGMNFLAMKLVPSAGVQDMRPVRVTTMGASPALPLRMVSVGTGVTTGITLWVVAEGRWEPQNFPSFTIDASELTWDWNDYLSNYESVRQSKEKALSGRGWQIESSLEIAESTIQSTLDAAIFSYDGSIYLGDSGTIDASSVGEATSDVNADLDVLFKGIAGGNVRVTRMRSDIAHSALSDDLVIQPSASQDEISNQLTPTHEIGTPCGYSGEELEGGLSDDGSPDATMDAGAEGTRPGDASWGCTAASSSPLDMDRLVLLGGAFLGVSALRTRRRRR